MVAKTETVAFEAKLSREEFIVFAIRRLRKPPYKGIHVVWSGFNQAFQDYFGCPARPDVDNLIANGRIKSVLMRGGIMITLLEDWVDKPKPEKKKKDKKPTLRELALAKILE